MDDNLVFDISDTASALRRAFDRRAAALGVTRAQWRVLAKLARSDGQRQVALAEALDVEPITLCRMVDRLAEAGLVERRRDEEDRRAWRIHLTAKALPLTKRLRGLAGDFLAAALEGLSKAEQAEARKALARIRTNIESAGSARRAS